MADRGPRRRGGKTNAAVHHTEGHCVKQIFMFMNILMTQHQMPVLFSYCGKNQDFYGSKRVTKKFKQAYQYDSSWKEAFLADLREMSTACQEEEEEEAEEERPREDPKLAFIRHRADQPVPLLPNKLKALNLMQAHTYLTELVKMDYWKRGGKQTKPVYKLLIWKPTWWPDHIWDWATIGCRFKEVPREKLPRGKEKVVLIKEVIKYYLESQNIDGETYVEPIRDVEKEDARIKNREKKKARNAMVNEENQVEGDKGYVYVDDNGGGDEERTEDADDKEDDDEEDDDKEDDVEEDDDKEDEEEEDDDDDDDDVASVPDDSFSSISTLTLDAGEKNDDDDDYESPRRDKPEQYRQVVQTTN